MDVDSVPFCGCDACDDGSEALLEQHDEWVPRAACDRVTVGGVQRQGAGWST